MFSRWFRLARSFCICAFAGGGYTMMARHVRTVKDVGH